MARVRRASYCEPKISNQIGLCKYHNWLLSLPQVKSYKCLHRKNRKSWCRHFRPNLKHDFWFNHEIPENIKQRILKT